MKEAEAAAELLQDDWNIQADIWSVTSYSELRKESERMKRWNELHPDKKQKECWLTRSLGDSDTPIVAVTDYVKLVSEQISAYITAPFTALGTDGFGRSDTRESLRTFFEVDRYYITVSALNSLYRTGRIGQSVVLDALKKYKIDTDKPNPLDVSVDDY